MGRQGDQRWGLASTASSVRWQRSRRVRYLVFVLACGMLTASVVVGAPGPSSAAGGSCAAADLKPALKELMVGQGLPSNANLVRGKDTLVRLFLSKPECASKSQVVTVTGIALAVRNGTTALGTGATFSPTGSITLPTFYTGTPPANSATDPILTVKGNVLTPCGAQASCPTDTAGFSATFAATVSYTATGVTGTQAVTFESVKPVAQKSNALRVLVVPMGDTSQLSSSQYSTAADAALQQGMNTLSRILPVPCLADPADQAGACFSTSLGSQYGGVRYSVNPGMLNLRSVADTYDSTGRFCGSQTNFDNLKATLAQFLESWNTANPNTPADRVVGVVDEAISNGVDSSPTGFSCSDGMAVTGSVAAWVRAMYTSQPSRTGGVLAMELSHTLGGVPFPRSFTTHSPNSAADGTAPARAYDVLRRAYIAASRSVMKYDTTSPWTNDTTLFEKLDQEFFLCHLGGPVNSECTTSGTTGVITGAGNGLTVVGSGVTGFDQASTKMVTTWVTSGVPRPQVPDPAAPDNGSPTRLVITAGPNTANRGINTARGLTDHDHSTPGEFSSNNKGLIAISFEGIPNMTAFAIYHCADPATQACKDNPAANGGILLYQAAHNPTPTTVGGTALLGTGTAGNYTQDPTRPDTNPVLQGGAVAWVARCATCAANGPTSIHIAPESDRTKVVEIPIASGAAQTDPAWNVNGSTIAWVAAGNIWKATVNRGTTPYTVTGVTKIYSQGGSNPIAATPTWSTDSSRIYFGATNAGIRYVMATGGNSSPLVATSAKESQPSQGPTLMAYTKKSNSAMGTDVWTVNPASPSSTQKLLKANADQPYASADGRVSFRSEGKLYSVVASDGSGLTQLSTGPDDQNPTASGTSFAFDRAFGSDREVMLATLGGQTVSGQVTGPIGPNTKGELRLTCANGLTYILAVGVPVEQQSATEGTLRATYDPSLACGGPALLQWICTNGFNLCTQGPGSILNVVNSNKTPVASITSPAAGTVVSPTSKLALNGSASSAQGQLTGNSLQWYVSGPGLPQTPVGPGNQIDLPAINGAWGNGELLVTLKATDALNQVSTTTTRVVVDGTAPNPIVFEAPNDNSSSTTATYSWNVIETGGSAPEDTEQYCQIDDGPKVPCNGTVTYTNLSEGEHTFTLEVRDGAGNVTVVQDVFTVDSGAPTTVATTSPAPNELGWNNTNVNVQLSSSDGSGVVQSVTYSLSGAQSGGATVPGSLANFTITAPGTTTVTYFATDGAGNAEPPKQIVVNIDKTAPTAAVTGEPTLLGIPGVCVTLTGTCTYSGTASDSVSGVSRVELTFTGQGLLGGEGFTANAVCTGCGTPGTKTWTFTPAPLQLLLGNYTVTAIAYDRAGNASAPASAPTVLHVI